MSYVPIVITPPPPPSPRVQELSEQLSQVIVDFERRFPDLSSAEVRRAAQLATQRRGKGGVESRHAVAAVVGVAAMLAGVAVFVYQRGAVEGVAIPWVMVGVVGLIVVVGVAAVLRKMGE